MPGRQSKPKPLAVNVSNAADMLGLSKSTIYRLLANHDLKAKKAGDTTLVLMASIDAYLAELPDFIPGQDPGPLRRHAPPSPPSLRAVK